MDNFDVFDDKSRVTCDMDLTTHRKHADTTDIGNNLSAILEIGNDCSWLCIVKMPNLQSGEKKGVIK